MPRHDRELSEFKSASASLSRDLAILENLGLVERVQGFNGQGINLNNEGIEFAKKIGKQLQ